MFLRLSFWWSRKNSPLSAMQTQAKKAGISDFQCKKIPAFFSFKEKHGRSVTLVELGGRVFLITISYLSLQIIRPLERSYGDISIVTLSPGKILM